MQNLKLVEDQPHWRVAAVALFAKAIGVLIHVEGIPFGSSRNRRKRNDLVTDSSGCVFADLGVPRDPRC